MFKDLPAKLASTKSIWIASLLTVALTLVFALVMQLGGFQIIDEMQDPEAVRAHIEAMTRDQRMTHAWLTATVDVVYPFAYAACFAGLCLRYLGRPGQWLSWLVALAIPADLIEGFAQVVALHGGFFILPLKAVVTPIKMVCWMVPGAGALLALGIAARRRFFSSL